VELLEPAAGPENVRRVAAGGSEFCLTSVAHYLRARAQWGDLPARYAAVVVQRSPMAGLVRDDSTIATPADLAGARVGGPPDSRLVAEYQAALDHLGLPRAELVAMDYGAAPAALGRGEIDAVADYVDLVPRTRRQAGVAVRAVPFDVPVYSSGLVAADRLPEDVVDRMAAAIVAALERQRKDPEAGVTALLARYPDVDPAEALEGWSLAEPNIFTDDRVGAMDEDRWAATLEFVAGAHGVPVPRPASVYRPERLNVSVW
jgi:ABC-type nitrate/sulfonate/bicarbonate transport system substrate-binding protein